MPSNIKQEKYFQTVQIRLYWYAKNNYLLDNIKGTVSRDWGRLEMIEIDQT